MPFDLIVHRPSENPPTTTVKDVISFEMTFGVKNRVTIDQTGGRSCEYRGYGVSVSGGTDTDDSHFD